MAFRDENMKELQEKTAIIKEMSGILDENIVTIEK